MKREELLDAMGNIRDEWIEDARTVHVRRPRWSLLAAALVMGLMLSVGAFAIADTDGFYDLLYTFSPELAQALKPVQMSCVDNGIELKVISADVENNTARVFIGLRDLEGNRVDETCDLYDSYYINLPGDSLIGHCSFSSFDEETRTALFVVAVSRNDGKPIHKNKLTFSLSQFLSGKQEMTKRLELDWSLAGQSPKLTKDFVTQGWGWSAEAGDYTTDVAMVPENVLLQPADGVSVTAIGFVDELLRIQVHYERILETDNHGFLWLEDAQGKEKQVYCHHSFWDEDHTGSYEEYLFKITPEELSRYQLWGQFCTADQLHKGDWEITFPLT